MIRYMRRRGLSFSMGLRLPEVIPAVGLPALVILIGLQCIRVLVAGLTWTLGDTYGLGAPVLGIIALGIFGASFLAGPLRRRVSYRGIIWATAGSLIVCRTLLQFSPGGALLDIVWAGLAIVAFVLFLPVYLDEARRQGNSAMPRFAGGFLSGLILDTIIYGTAGTLDIAYQIWKTCWTRLPLISRARPGPGWQSGLFYFSSCWFCIICRPCRPSPAGLPVPPFCGWSPPR
jgi:hypothetical protein